MTKSKFNRRYAPDLLEGKVALVTGGETINLAYDVREMIDQEKFTKRDQAV